MFLLYYYYFEFKESEEKKNVLDSRESFKQTFPQFILIYGDQVLRPRHTMDIIDLDRDINKSKLYH